MQLVWRTWRQGDELGPGLADLQQHGFGLALQGGRDLLSLVHAAAHGTCCILGRARDACRAQEVQSLFHLSHGMYQSPPWHVICIGAHILTEQYMRQEPVGWKKTHLFQVGVTGLVGGFNSGSVLCTAGHHHIVQALWVQHTLCG